MSRNTLILIIFIALAILIGGFFLFGKNTGPSPIASPGINQPNSAAGQTFVVKITSQGFSPETVTIKKGDTVIWLNATSEFHWPASNLHPTHTIYPEFDPREPVAPGDTWSFTFQKVGTWRYHDHLRPIDRGVVEVME
ncbi:MAG: cupredoxin domain-containing protein [Candidatus Portnoybacteria bacterium]|nr:cupredoxin domain-containing protein [Candidatus Portnoybacteria bacterium]